MIQEGVSLVLVEYVRSNAHNICSVICSQGIHVAHYTDKLMLGFSGDQ